MERIDIAIIGCTEEAFATARSAAKGGVRAIVIADQDQDVGPSLCRIKACSLAQLEIPPTLCDTLGEQLQVNELPPVSFGGEEIFHVGRRNSLVEAIRDTAKQCGAEIRVNTQIVEAQLDADGWHLQLSKGEPIRASILVIADGPRSTALSMFGIGNAQRFTTTGAELQSYLCATWNNLTENLDDVPAHQIDYEQKLSHRVDIVRTTDSVSVAMGPVWRQIDLRHPLPDLLSTSGCLHVIEAVSAALTISSSPQHLELQEWRMDALPAPATFDGGIIIGSAAGHTPITPLAISHESLAAADLTGHTAAQCIIDQNWTADALKSALATQYEELTLRKRAELSLLAHGMYESREYTKNDWRV